MSAGSSGDSPWAQEQVKAREAETGAGAGADAAEGTAEGAGEWREMMNGDILVRTVRSPAAGAPALQLGSVVVARSRGYVLLSANEHSGSGSGNAPTGTGAGAGTDASSQPRKVSPLDTYDASCAFECVGEQRGQVRACPSLLSLPTYA